MKNTILPFSKLLLCFMLLFQSCGTVNKLFHKQKSVTDSTYSHHEKSDSLTSVDSSSLHKENTTTILKSDSSKSNKETTITERTTIEEFNDSGKVKKKTIIDKKTEIKNNSSSGSISVFENSAKIDSNELKKAAQLSKQKSDSGHLQKKEKEVVNEVHKTKSLLWLLLLIPAYIIYRNWPKIKAIALHLFTGL